MTRLELAEAIYVGLCSQAGSAVLAFEYADAFMTEAARRGEAASATRFARPPTWRPAPAVRVADGQPGDAGGQDRGPAS